MSGIPLNANSSNSFSRSCITQEHKDASSFTNSSNHQSFGWQSSFNLSAEVYTIWQRLSCEVRANLFEIWFSGNDLLQPELDLGKVCCQRKQRGVELLLLGLEARQALRVITLIQTPTRHRLTTLTSCQSEWPKVNQYYSSDLISIRYCFRSSTSWISSWHPVRCSYLTEVHTGWWTNITNNYTDVTHKWVSRFLTAYQHNGLYSDVTQARTVTISRAWCNALLKVKLSLQHSNSEDNSKAMFTGRHLNNQHVEPCKKHNTQRHATKVAKLKHVCKNCWEWLTQVQIRSLMDLR